MKKEMTVIDVPNKEVVSVNPYDKMVEMALSSDVGIEKLEKLLELKERHEANEAKKSYHKAMAEFKANAISIVKDKQGHNNMFASLANIIDVVTPMMGDHGLTLSWETEQSESTVKVTAKVTHMLGYSESTSLSSGLELSGNKSNIHGLGSAISYLERYTAKAILGIAEKDQDNDAANVLDFINESQVADINAKLDEFDDDRRKKFLEWIKANGAPTVEHIQAKNYDFIVKTMENKK